VTPSVNGQPSRFGKHVTPDEFLADSALGRSVFEAVHRIISSFGDVEVKTTRSQVAFRRRRGFAYVWLPGKYLDRPQAEVVLSIALDRELASPRFKEVAHPARRIWQHHLEIVDITDVDDEVREWLRAAYAAAA
jgi:hypothetical protein